MTRIPDLLLLTFVAISSPAQAREPAPPPTVEVTLKTLSIGPEITDTIYLQAHPEAPPSKLTFHKYRRSDPIEYKGPAQLVFFRQEPSPDPDAPPRRIPVARSFLRPEHPPEELLLFFQTKTEPDPDTGALFDVVGMDDSTDTFPKNSVVVFNATGFNLYGMVDKTHQEFSSGPSDVFKMPPSLYTAFAVETRTEYRMVFENTLQFGEDTRVILMLRPPRRKHSIRFQCYSILERVFDEEAEAPKEKEDS